MIIYRGYTKQPILLTSEARAELLELDKLAEGCLNDEGRPSLVQFDAKYPEKTGRFFELLYASKNQVFSDQREIAEEFAGKDGFVVAVDVPDEKVKEYYAGERPVRGGHLSSNFEIPAEDLYKLSEEKKYQVEAMNKGLGEGISGSEDKG